MTRDLRYISFFGLIIAGTTCLLLVTCQAADAASGDSSGGQFATWASLIAALAALTGVITFWHLRGRAEAEAINRANEAYESAKRANDIAKDTAKLLTEARVEFARDYATHRDMMTSENRTAEAINTLRTEIRADMRVVMDRLDRWSDRSDK